MVRSPAELMMRIKMKKNVLFQFKCVKNQSQGKIKKHKKMNDEFIIIKKGLKDLSILQAFFSPG